MDTRCLLTALLLGKKPEGYSLIRLILQLDPVLSRHLFHGERFPIELQL